MAILVQTCVIVILFMGMTLGLKCNIGKCVRDNDMEGFIVGGKPTTIDLFPHAVYLSMVYQKWICGSSILTQWILITAAHCVDNIHGEFKIDALAGHENLDEVTIIRHVNKFTAHELYQSLTHKEYDLALMFLDNALPIGKTAPIKRVMIRRTFPINEQSAQVAGWGVTNDALKQKTIILKSTQQKLVDVKTCTSYHYWRPGLLCAGDSHENRPSNGDSGSGLVTDEYQQIGIVAFRVNYMPSVVFYTNVSFHYHWIMHEAIRHCIQETDDSDD